MDTHIYIYIYVHNSSCVTLRNIFAILTNILFVATYYYYANFLFFFEPFTRGEMKGEAVEWRGDRVTKGRNDAGTKDEAVEVG